MSISRSDKVRPGAPDNLHLPAPESVPGALPRRCGRWPGLRLTLLPDMAASCGGYARIIPGRADLRLTAPP